MPKQKNKVREIANKDLKKRKKKPKRKNRKNAKY